MLGLISRCFSGKPAPSMTHHPSLQKLHPSSRQAVLDMTKSLRGERREAALTVLAEFGNEGIARFDDFGLDLKEKRLSSHDSTYGYYTSEKRRVVLNSRMSWDDEEGLKTVRHELFHAMDHILGKEEHPDTFATKLDSLALSSLSAQDQNLQSLYQDYRARGAAQYALDYRDSGELPDDDNVFNGKDFTTIAQDGNRFVVDTDPTWFSRQRGVESCVVGALGAGLMAVGGVVCPVLGLAALGLAGWAGKDMAKEALDRFVRPAQKRTLSDEAGKQLQVESRGDKFVVTAEPGYENRMQTWSEYAMLTDQPSEYFAEAGAYMLTGGVHREILQFKDAPMVDYVSERWERFTGQAWPENLEAS